MKKKITKKKVIKNKKLGSYYLPPVPHLNISDSNIKTVALANTEYAITYDTIEDQQGISFTAGNSKITFKEAGDYLINISAVVDSTNNTSALMDIWFKKNGTNIDRSNTQVGLNNANLQIVLAVPFIIDVNQGDYIELFYSATQNTARLLAIGTQSSPTRPACPSIIVTINKVSK